MVLTIGLTMRTRIFGLAGLCVVFATVLEASQHPNSGEQIFEELSLDTLVFDSQVARVTLGFSEDCTVPLNDLGPALSSLSRTTQSWLSRLEEFGLGSSSVKHEIVILPDSTLLDVMDEAGQRGVFGTNYVVVGRESPYRVSNSPTMFVLEYALPPTPDILTFFMNEELAYVDQNPVAIGAGMIKALANEIDLGKPRYPATEVLDFLLDDEADLFDWNGSPSEWRVPFQIAALLSCRDAADLRAIAVDYALSIVEPRADSRTEEDRSEQRRRTILRNWISSGGLVEVFRECAALFHGFLIDRHSETAVEWLSCLDSPESLYKHLATSWQVSSEFFALDIANSERVSDRVQRFRKLCERINSIDQMQSLNTEFLEYAREECER